jgi:hypothetical protein
VAVITDQESKTMRLINYHKVRTTLLIFGTALFLSMAMQSVLASGFAKVSYEGYQVVWDLALPEGATGVSARVVHTPSDGQAESYEEAVFEQGTAVYPFNGQLEDGSYSWELRLIYQNARADALNRSGSAEGGAIDENGRRVGLADVALSAPNGKTQLQNRGRNSTQSGGFMVVNGAIPDMTQSERKIRQKNR